MADEADTETPQSPAKRRPAWILGALTFLAFALMSVLAFFPLLRPDPNASALTAAHGAPAPASPSVPSTRLPGPSNPPSAVGGAAPEHIIFPAVGMDQAISPLTPTPGEVAGGTLTPPKTLDAYWLTPYGRPGPGSDNTTYIIGHSWEGKDSPFNRLSTDAKPGDALTITTPAGTLHYVVDSVTTHNKTTLNTSDIWNKIPGKIILISCYTADLWGKNVIVEASPK